MSQGAPKYDDLNNRYPGDFRGQRSSGGTSTRTDIGTIRDIFVRLKI